jgi:hypothetical protein
MPRERTSDLTDGIAGVSRGARIDGAAARSPRILRHMRRHVHMAAFGGKLPRVETLVAPHRDPPVARNLLQHQQCGITLGAPVGFQQLRIHDQPVAILYQQIAAIAQLGLLASALARQLGDCYETPRALTPLERVKLRVKVQFQAPRLALVPARALVPLLGA